MITLLASTAATVAALVLFVSSLGHVRAGSLAAVLATHGIHSAAARRVVAGAVPTLEISLGLLGTAAIIVDGGLRTEAFAAVGCLYAAYALYALWLLRRRPWAPCGCSSGQHPVNAWVILRAGALSAVSVVAAVFAEQIFSGQPPREQLLAALSGVGFASLLWAIPDAMSQASTGASAA